MDTILVINIVILGCLLGILLYFENKFNSFCNDIITVINDIVGGITTGVNDIKNTGQSAINAISHI
jgi:hypothetical protein